MSEQLVAPLALGILGVTVGTATGGIDGSTGIPLSAVFTVLSVTLPGALLFGRKLQRLLDHQSERERKDVDRDALMKKLIDRQERKDDMLRKLVHDMDALKRMIYAMPCQNCSADGPAKKPFELTPSGEPTFDLGPDPGD